jgi:hypothetical protein
MVSASIIIPRRFRIFAKTLKKIKAHHKRLPYLPSCCHQTATPYPFGTLAALKFQPALSHPPSLPPPPFIAATAHNYVPSKGRPPLIATIPHLWDLKARRSIFAAEVTKLTTAKDVERSSDSAVQER